MDDFINSQWSNEWIIDPHVFHSANFLPWNGDFSYFPPNQTMSSDTPDVSAYSTSSNSRSDSPLETVPNPKSKKRRQRSESSQPDALIRPRKTRTLRDPHDTAKVREKGACLTCKRKRKEVGLDREVWIYP